MSTQNSRRQLMKRQNAVAKSNQPESWSEVFVPSGFPTYSFYDREKFGSIVDDFILKPGYRILALSGLSRTGKTNLLIDRFNKASITAHWLGGANIETFDQFLNKLREKLSLRPIQTEHTTSRGLELQPLAPLAGLLAKLNIGGSKTVIENDDVEEIDILRKLNGSVVVIDDFHRVPEKTQRKILAFIKLLCEQPDRLKGRENIDFRFIFVFIPNTDTAGFAMWTELRTRTKYLEIPLWQSEELLNIAQKWLIERDKVLLGLKKLADESYGLPSMMQLLCRNYCEIHLQNTKPEKIASIRDDQLDIVFSITGSEIWGPSGDSVYRELIALRGRTRPDQNKKLTSKIDNRIGDIYQMIWYALSLPSVPPVYREGLPNFKIDNRLEITIDAITQRLEKLTDIDTSQNDYIRTCIQFMSDETRITYPQRVSREDATDDSTNKRAQSHLNDPLFEYYSETDSLVIYDPAVLVGLSHSDKHSQKFRFPEPK
jgi:hypothetical protein